MTHNKPSDQLLRELAALKQRLTQAADPIERRTLLAKMSSLLRESDVLAEDYIPDEPLLE